MSNEQKKSLQEFVLNAKTNPLLFFPQVHIARIVTD